MVASDRPTIRHERREWWRRQLSRQQSENVSVTNFCRQLGVSISTFYYWKKRAHLVWDRAQNQAPFLSLWRALRNTASILAFPWKRISNAVSLSVLFPRNGRLTSNRVDFD